MRPTLKQVASEQLIAEAKKRVEQRNVEAATAALEAGRNDQVEDLKDKEVRSGPRSID